MNRLPHIKPLDGVRGVAALMVMIFHWVQAFPGTLGPIEPFRKIAVFGQTGVDLFFVLSGFLITRILLNSLEESAFFRNFYARRILRIFPLYYGFLTFYYLVWTKWMPQGQPSGALWYFAYIPNIQMTFGDQGLSGPMHFWSLAIEEHFYLAWPILIYLTPFRKVPWLCAATIGLSIVSRILLLHWGFGVFYFTLCRLDGLAIGAMIAWLERRHSGLDSLRGHSMKLIVGLTPLVLVLWFVNSGKGLAWLQALKFLWVALLFGALLCVSILAAPSSYLHKVLNSRALRWVGKVSYGSYVFHWACFEVVTKSLKITHPLANLVTGFGLSFLVAGLSYNFYEAPFLRLKSRFTSSGGHLAGDVLPVQAHSQSGQS